MGVLLEALDRAGPARVVCSTCGFTRPPCNSPYVLEHVACRLPPSAPAPAGSTYTLRTRVTHHCRAPEMLRCLSWRWHRPHASRRSTRHTAAAASREVAASRDELPDMPIAKTNPVSGRAMSALQECGGAAPAKQKAGQGACLVERSQKVITAPGARNNGSINDLRCLPKSGSGARQKKEINWGCRRLACPDQRR